MFTAKKIMLINGVEYAPGDSIPETALSKPKAQMFFEKGWIGGGSSVAISVTHIPVPIKKVNEDGSTETVIINLTVGQTVEVFELLQKPVRTLEDIIKETSDLDLLAVLRGVDCRKTVWTFCEKQAEILLGNRGE